MEEFKMMKLTVERLAKLGLKMDVVRKYDIPKIADVKANPSLQAVRFEHAEMITMILKEYEKDILRFIGYILNTRQNTIANADDIMQEIYYMAFRSPSYFNDFTYFFHTVKKLSFVAMRKEVRRYHKCKMTQFDQTKMNDDLEEYGSLEMAIHGTKSQRQDDTRELKLDMVQLLNLPIINKKNGEIATIVIPKRMPLSKCKCENHSKPWIDVINENERKTATWGDIKSLHDQGYTWSEINGLCSQRVDRIFEKIENAFKAYFNKSMFPTIKIAKIVKTKKIQIIPTNAKLRFRAIVAK
jgi:hypothetical protein